LKRIGLLSDTHGFIDDQILGYLKNCDEIWHAGDFGTVEVSDRLSSINQLRGVYGNVDGHELRKIHPLHNRFFCELLDVWITHIGGYPGNYNPSIKSKILADPPDLFICGHSHILKVIRDPITPGLMHFNPGASGHEGLHQIRTMLRFTVDQKKINHLEVVELGPH
jgi:uncharacterized protein